MYITFRQNNSGGYFIIDENVGHYVIIEGDDLEQILDKANYILKDYREYCSCCGERWNDDWIDENDLTEKPMIYNEDAYIYKSQWHKEQTVIIIYKKDGQKQIINNEI